MNIYLVLLHRDRNMTHYLKILNVYMPSCIKGSKVTSQNNNFAVNSKGDGSKPYLYDLNYILPSQEKYRLEL